MEGPHFTTKGPRFCNATGSQDPVFQRPNENTGQGSKLEVAGGKFAPRIPLVATNLTKKQINGGKLLPLNVEQILYLYTIYSCRVFLNNQDDQP